MTRSALWAAWADALGFISELTDERGLRRRLGKHGPQLALPVEWRRRVGGRFGAEAVLPAGCYSDDTQLRLAVGRAVTGSGFDVEAFARVELAVWPSYALGGGHSSKAAARNLAKPDAAWFANFYDGWTNGGGNGVSMRIQPHVWAAADPAGHALYLGDVLVDAVTTHGHPRALVGAILHAAALGETLATGTVPGPGRWPSLLSRTMSAVQLIDRYPEINGIWRPSWESQVGMSLAEAWADVSTECEKMLELAADALGVDAHGHGDATDLDALAASYVNLVHGLGLKNEEIRGSGLHTVVAALALSAAVGPDVRAAAVTAARAIGTDTDTIATMAAAVSGAADGADDAPEVLDGDYIAAEAQRLASIALGEPTKRFAYPDLLDWEAPRTQSDACGLADDRPALAGLGWCEPIAGLEPAEFQNNIWRWMRTDFGQTVLLKQRLQLRQLPAGAWPARRVVVDVARRQGTILDVAEGDVAAMNTSEAAERRRDSRRGGPREQRGKDDTGTVRTAVASRPETEVRREPVVPEQGDRPRGRDINVDQIFGWVAHRKFSPEALGYALRQLAVHGTVEQVVAFSVLVHQAAQRSGRGDGITTV
ncbi:ADP-ribosylglycohydrolase family protein [Mycobacterium sp. JS623]|uniref:ADP-ribosylglycohydrolase family protein n=1 Tax=Mycobacterium sp. JS623 TaxID=212767 RepID=UPI0012F87081|nr:ADP-ribosylglycohydrolase family protein [Mycobacterium sp. JS623]